MTNYNLTWLNTANQTFSDVAYEVNAMTSGAFGALTLLVIFILILLGMQGDFNDRFIVASFITMLVGIPFWAIGFVAWWIAVIPIAFLVIGLMIKQFG